MIKNALKKSKIVMRLYHFLLPYYCLLFTKEAVKMLYRQTFQKKLNLDEPKDLNEKIQWLKVYSYRKNALVAKCADKYLVRDYVKQCGFKEILNEVYYTYDKPAEIDWDKLPSKFALKYNRAAGMNIICQDKSKLNKEEVMEKVKCWYKAKTGETTCELHYRRAKPKIICEKYIESFQMLPIDYKIYCFNGKPYVTMVCVDRETEVKFVFMDTQWNRVFIDTPNYPDSIIPKKPESYNKMLKYAEVLSKPFPLVRVDFYELNGEPIFGEMTFTPFGGYITCMNKGGLEEAGKILKLPQE